MTARRAQAKEQVDALLAQLQLARASWARLKREIDKAARFNPSTKALLTTPMQTAETQLQAVLDLGSDGLDKPSAIRIEDWFARFSAVLESQTELDDAGISQLRTMSQQQHDAASARLWISVASVTARM